MKIVAALFVVLSVSAMAQKGAVSITFLDNPSLNPVPTCVYLKNRNDTTEKLLDCTTENGRIHLNQLHAGINLLRFESFGKSLGEHSIFVQANQLYSTTFLVDTLFSNVAMSTKGAYDFGPNGQGRMNSSMVNVDAMKVSSMPIRNAQEIACVQIVRYKVPLINNSGSSYATFSAEDIRRLPSRNAGEISSYVGGVARMEGDDQLHIRGARSDANTYFIDGMRVKSLDGIPKSYIGGVSVYTGGIPANYGDVTGGVISIESRPIGRPTYRPFNYSAPVKRVPAFNVELEEEDVAETTFEPDYEPRISADQFLPIYENMFLSPIENRHSTFGLDVDRASWTYVQQQFYNGIKIHRDAVKMEEMINAFEYENLEVNEEEAIALKVERANCAWNSESELVTIHLKAKDLPQDKFRDPHNFVFLIDVSGSMGSYGKIGLLKEGLSDLVKTLLPNDQVAIVTYAGNVGVVLESTSNKDSILMALENLESGGSTNGMGGVQLAYEQAEANFDPSKNNRIILCTDGDFNVGISDPDDLETFISEKRGQGIYLTALGYGMGNYRNDVLETLADRGDGNHFYINSLIESKKVLCDEVGNLLNLARDAKLDVEFDAHMVSSYRLIGFENRMMAHRDFMDDTKDGGELGYGHEVMAVYEVQRCSDASTKDSDVIATVKLRYKLLEAKESKEFTYELNGDAEKSEAVKLNTVVGFGLMLRDSAYKGDLTRDSLREYAQSMKVENEDDQKLLEMIGTFTLSEL